VIKTGGDDENEEEGEGKGGSDSGNGGGGERKLGDFVKYFRIRGVPYDAEVQDILDFFKEVKDIDESDIALRFQRDGRFSGLAMVRVHSAEDEQIALDMHRKYLGKRYVEVFHSEKEEFQSAANQSGKSKGPTAKLTDIATEENGVVKARGLPYDSTFDQIKEFFKEFKLHKDGVYRQYFRDRPDGQCFVVF